MRRVLPQLLVIVALLLWFTKPVPANAAQNPPTATADLKAADAKTSDYVGSETCAACHAEVSKKFASNPHAALALMHNGKGATCESCHGPGKAHVDGGGDVTKIFRFAKATVKQVDETCLGCHSGAHPNFERSPHAMAKVSCTGCHSVHAHEDGDSLLKISQPGLCYSCHTSVKAAFAQPFHHQVDEGLMKCSDCHDPHGTFQRKQLRTTADNNAICTKCHTETAGPFVYEHPVVKTQGCTTCHSPHGSPNPRLMNVANVNTLCLQCHSSINLTAFPNAVSEQGGPVHNQAAQYTPCTNCHSQIHGSNAAYNFFK
jgi:DmsE family decaheme c-type cytochrome